MSPGEIALMAITNDPVCGGLWHAAGVGRLLVDLETYGKAERQRNRDTVKSDHSVADIAAMRAAVPTAHIVARCEPVRMPRWREHIELVLATGPSSLMVPMVECAADVDRLVDTVAGRARLIVMIETASALAEVDPIARSVGEGTLFVGLNDLHIQLGQRFMFEPLSAGQVDSVASVAQRHRLSFGFGGLARVGAGLLDPALVVREHVRLGSELAILARSFFNALRDPMDVAEVAAGIHELRAVEAAARDRTREQQVADFRGTSDRIKAVAEAAGESR